MKRGLQRRRTSKQKKKRMTVQSPAKLSTYMLLAVDIMYKGQG